MFLKITEENKIYYIIGVSVLFLVLYLYFTNGTEHLTQVTSKPITKKPTSKAYDSELLKSIALIQFEKYLTPSAVNKYKKYIYNYKEIVKIIDTEIKNGNLHQSSKKDKSYINMKSQKIGSGSIPRIIVDAIIIHKFKEHLNTKTDKGRYYSNHLQAYKAKICEIVKQLIDNKTLDKDVKYDSVYKNNCLI